MLHNRSDTVRHACLVLLALLAAPALGQSPRYVPQPGSSARPVDPRSMPYTAAEATPPPQNLQYGPLPGPPHQPQPSYRPDNWPGATTSDQPGRYPTTNPADYGQTLQTSAQVQPINDVQVLATVWSDPILASDVMPYVNDVFAANKAQIPPEQHEKVRTILIKQRISQLIDTKTLVNDAKRTIPKENLKNVETKVFEAYDKHELPKMLKKTNSTSRADLDQKLRAMGSSIDRERQSFFEKTLAQQWVMEKVRPEKDAEVTRDDMLSWYREHLAEYETPPKARWQQLSVRSGKTRSKGEAWRMLARLGNMVWSGVPFADVAKQHSEGVTAADGGLRDWTTKGSLVSKPLDQALFALEVGKLSEIIEDETGFHIILVLERNDTTRVPFTQAQQEIKEKIKKQRQQELVNKYVAEVKKETPVWTIFDGEEQDTSEASDKVSERPGPATR